MKARRRFLPVDAHPSLIYIDHVESHARASVRLAKTSEQSAAFVAETVIDETGTKATAEETASR